jgi:hypothetical protein
MTVSLKWFILPLLFLIYPLGPKFKKGKAEDSRKCHHDTHDHINEVVESHQLTSVQLQMLQELMSKITSKTNEFAAKFPELESKRIYSEPLI